MSPTLRPVPASALLALAAAALLLSIALLLIRGEPGLAREHFANSHVWQGQPDHTDVSPPGLASKTDVHALASHNLFSLRWRGWVTVDEGGLYRFALAADETAYLAIDGQRVVTKEADERRRAVGRLRLTAGAHRLEVGLSQTGGRSYLQLRWARPKQEWAVLPASSLYAHREPGTLDRAVRRATGRWSLLKRRLVAALLFAVAAALVAAGIRRLAGVGRWAVPRSWPEPLRRAGRTLYYPALFAGAFLATFPLTARTLAGDDIRYLDAAYFSKKLGWILNRYAHIDLLHGFMWLTGDNPFLAGRVYWSTAFAVTVVALAVGARALGPGLQVRTTVVAVFLLVSQTFLMNSLGAAFADYTVLTLITLALALYLRDLSDARRDGVTTRPEWRALAIGALTVAAIKSKETGIILLWLPVLFLWTDGQLDLRNFRRRCLYWAGGGALAYLALMLLDWRFLGDPWFSLRPANLAALGRVSLVEDTGAGYNPFAWLEFIWPQHPARVGQRHLWILAGAAALAAFLRRQRLELRLLSLLPLLYLGMMAALHGDAVYSLSSRHLIPIVGATCLVGALFVRDSGLEEVRWRWLFSPWVLVPGLAVTALAVYLLAPIHVGSLPAETLPRPVAILADSRTVTAVFAIAVAVSLLPTLGRRWRPAVVGLGLIVAFGPAFEQTRDGLERRVAIQRSDRILYPWTAFEAALQEARPGRILVSRRLSRDWGMTGKHSTRSRIARLYFRRPRLHVGVGDHLKPGTAFAIGTLEDLERWRPQVEARGLVSQVDASGLLVLVRPPSREPGEGS